MGAELALLQQIRKSYVPKSIVNGFSDNGLLKGFNNVTISNALHCIPCGLATANTLKTLLSLSGSGVVGILCAWNSSANYIFRLKVTIDGVVAFDATKNGAGYPYWGMIAIGAICNSSNGEILSISPQEVSFNNSFLVEMSINQEAQDVVSIGTTYILT